MLVKLFYCLRCVLFDVHVWYWLPEPNLSLEYKTCKYSYEATGYKTGVHLSYTISASSLEEAYKKYLDGDYEVEEISDGDFVGYNSHPQV